MGSFVPAAEDRGIPETIIGREIDHLFPRRQKGGGEAHRNRMREREENEIRPGTDFFHLEIVHLQVDPAGKFGELVSQADGRVDLGGQGNDLHSGMVEQDFYDLDPGITGCSHHGDFQHFRASRLALSIRKFNFK